MSRKSGDSPQVDAAKRASMGIAWSVVAGIAYLGLIGTALDALGKAINVPTLANPSTNVALYSIKEHINGSYATLATAAIAAIPVAIVAGIALGIAARIRPKMGVFSSLLFVSGVLGLIGILVLGYAQLANAAEAQAFVLAVGTIVVVAILVRIQHFIRRFYQRSPAIASVLIAVLLLIYFVLSNGQSISFVFLSDLNIWLALVAFAIVIYSGYHHIRAGQRLRKRR